MKKIDLEGLLRKGEPVNFDDIKKETGTTKKQAKELITEMKRMGVPIQHYTNEADYKVYFYIGKGIIPSKNYNAGLNDGEYIFGVESDIHVGDKGYDSEAHNEFYNILDDRGANLVLNSGDLITGVDVYRNQHVDLNIHTKMEQAEYYVEEVPNLTRGKTLIIDGNHDVKNMESSFSPGAYIGEHKNNYEYLGQISADVELSSGLIARLIHLKGNAYTIGYNLQKYIRRLSPPDMPNLIFKGHTHDYAYVKIQDIDCFHTGTFQHSLSNFAKELGFQDCIGGWILNIEIENHKLKRLVPELLTF